MNGTIFKTRMLWKRIKFLPKPVLQTIYYKTILPSVLYGTVVWAVVSYRSADFKYF